ncbi:MAG: T9SS type A sorting domain-containing protein [Sphingobacteriaceae bacterium]|nr:T9SS type A sorting domain-containing protein [Sphingobacteriaceae bacterium]
MRINGNTIGIWLVAANMLNAGLSFAQPYGCQQAKNQQQLPPMYYSAENLRSDTIDVLKYTINLEIGNFSTKDIKGNTAIRFAPKMNNQNHIRLDLLKLTIDSVKENNSALLYSYNDTILKVNFLAAKNVVDTSTITVYYKGQPSADQLWGGFYFDNTGGAEYAYNLGVGFSAKPHNFGRVWFPCFDNFVEHSKYEFNITCDTARKAYCNGVLMSNVVNGAKRTRNWIMNQEIPSYLASVSVAKYTQVNLTANTLLGPKPVNLVGVAGDTAAMKVGFTNLLNCITGFENYFGPYKWNRVGYCLVPFNSGAMEHATNISYPRAVAGNIAYESVLMAHELAHHWWGDLVTCETQEDMWINEGMATFCAYMFLEWQYGKNSYLSSVKSEHMQLVHHLHHKEGGFRAISGIPHSLTYGDYVYKKGADMIHTLRGYMGDAAFFNACKYTMIQKELKNVNTLELRDLFQTSSGQNLVSFFNDWVLNPGWPQFDIDSVNYINAGPSTYSAIVSLKQKKLGAPSLYSNVPLEISFFKSDWTRVVQTVTMSGANATFTLTLPYLPVYHALNYDSKIGDATSFESRVIKAPGNIGLGLAKMTMNVTSSGADSSLIRVIHNFVSPDPFKSNPNNHRLSDQRYWKVEGIRSNGFHATARFNYDGSKNLGTYSYLDTLLASINGDSIRMFYRQNAKDDWKLVMNVFKFQSGLKTGWIEIDTLKNGEYTFGNSTDTTNIIQVKENYLQGVEAKIYPNPIKDYLIIELPTEPQTEFELQVCDINGKIVLQEALKSKKSKIRFSEELAKGNYIAILKAENKILYSKKLLKE